MITSQSAFAISQLKRLCLPICFHSNDINKSFCQRPVLVRNVLSSSAS